jgi:hypothetical protein
MTSGYLERDPIEEFHSWEYLRHNQRRQEHLATLGLDLAGTSVLEVGAGIGDHTTFFLDRGCSVVTTEGRAENVEILRKRHPGVESRQLDLNCPNLIFPEPFEVVYCYGLLYHLREPAIAIAHMARWCRRVLLVETCVTFGNDLSINPVTEQQGIPSQALSGVGCRPTRRWVFEELRKHFPFVYLPVTQPWHSEFPIDWTASPPGGLTRAIFVASRRALENPLLREEVPMQQRRH